MLALVITAGYHRWLSLLVITACSHRGVERCPASMNPIWQSSLTLI
jgi:metal-dependent hydrolase (beta-lactamase superfamily II)